MPKPTETTTVEIVEVIRTMTPAEYVKAHDTEEAAVRRVTDLTHFVYFMVGELRGGPLADLTAEGIERLVAAYLDGARVGGR
jgi:hypothetical protein